MDLDDILMQKDTEYLDDIPKNENTQSTTDELMVLQKYFEHSDGQIDTSKIKLVVYTTILFLAMSNPGLNVIFSKLPKGDYMIVRTLTKGFVFSILFYILLKFYSD